MWRIRALVLMGVLVGMLIFGAVGVYAGWYWNSQTDVEGTSLRTIWTVVGDEKGSENYYANLNIALPEGAEIGDSVVAPSETLTFSSDSELGCDNDGLEAVVTFNVIGDGPGKKVRVTITADGKNIGRDIGDLGEEIVVKIDIPADDPSCGIR